mmetsp:Transcript_23769/g.94226  ORF Transcript_23769/g.94226 Transcript_23769/m.94226 type:complete len:239 (+) Transcript_23769:2241-2957(+)
MSFDRVFWRRSKNASTPGSWRKAAFVKPGLPFRSRRSRVGDSRTAAGIEVTRFRSSDSRLRRGARAGNVSGSASIALSSTMSSSNAARIPSPHSKVPERPHAERSNLGIGNGGRTLMKRTVSCGNHIAEILMPRHATRDSTCAGSGSSSRRAARLREGSGARRATSARRTSRPRRLGRRRARSTRSPRGRWLSRPRATRATAGARAGCAGLSASSGSGTAPRARAATPRGDSTTDRAS